MNKYTGTTANRSTQFALVFMKSILLGQNVNRKIISKVNQIVKRTSKPLIVFSPVELPERMSNTYRHCTKNEVFH